MYTHYNQNVVGKDANIFISHSTLDKNIAAAMETYLHEGLGIDMNSIFRFTRQNTIPQGEEFHKTILGAMKESNIAIFLITTNSVSSKYCYYEMGACWAFGIKPFVVYFEPLSVSDNIFKNLPFTQVQSSNIALDNNNGIYAMLEELKNIIYGNMYPIGDLSFHKYNFANAICEEILSASKLNLQDGIVFVHDSYNENVLKVGNASKDNITFHVDYTELRPKYAGYAIRLHDVSWGSFFEKNYVFSLDYMPQKGLKSFYIEFKGKDKKIIGRKQVRISEENYNKNISCQFCLKDININSIYWEQMSEIVFLFLDESEESPSDLIINNVCLKKNK